MKVNDDWADTVTLAHVMKDIERRGRRFYYKDNGQAMVLFYLDAKTAAELNRLSNNGLKPVLSGGKRLERERLMKKPARRPTENALADVPSWFRNIIISMGVVALAGLSSVGRSADSQVPIAIAENHRAAASAGGRGSVRGKVVVDGTHPQEYWVRHGDPIYARQTLSQNIQRVPPQKIGIEPYDVPNRTVRIDGQSRGLRDVFVYLRSAPSPSTIRPQLPPQTPLDVRRVTKWDFEPRTLVVHPGQRVRVMKSFDGPSTLDARPLINASVNVSLMGNPSTVDLEFKSAEKLPILVTDDVNPAATGYWLVLDHPYAAITGTDGTFEIRDLPAGTHELTFWHERVGYLDRKKAVVVKPNQATTLRPLHISSDRLAPRGT